MLYAILCYHDEAAVCSWSREQDEAVMGKLTIIQDRLKREGKLGPVARLMPTTAATTLRKNQEPPLVIDGPFAETKEALLGFYLVEVAGLEEALDIARELGVANPGGSYELRPVGYSNPGRHSGMTDLDWIEQALTGARPIAIAALLRYFRDLDTAEEAFQEACLRALTSWPKNGPPRDTAAWLILVGRNAGVDAARKRSRQEALPDEAALSDLEDAEAAIVERLDGSHYRDDILRLLFICCHPDLQRTQQIALALRIVSGLSVQQIARAFLVGESAMEQRITRAKGRVAKAAVPFEVPGPAERAERFAAVAAMLYLVFNEGYSAGFDQAEARAPLCDEAIRLARLLLRIFPSEPEMMGLAALMLVLNARAAARFDGEGAIVLLEDQDRSAWKAPMIAEGLALLDKAMRHNWPGPYQIQAAVAALHARAAKAEDTDWAQIEHLYASLEAMQPSPVVTLNRAVAVLKAQGPDAALALIEPLEDSLSGYFYFHGARGAVLRQLGRTEEARVSFNRAIALAGTAAEAAFIRSQLDGLGGAAARAC